MRKYFLLVPLVAALTAFTRPASSTEITLYGVVDGYVAVNIAGRAAFKAAAQNLPCGG